MLTTPFPPDDRSAGYERGTSVSKAWDLATTDAAIEVAGYVVAHLKELSGVSDDASDREAKLREFCRQVRRAGISASAQRLSRRRSSSIASSRMPRTWRRPSNGWCCLCSSRLGFSTARPAAAALAATTSPRGFHSGCGTRCPIRRFWMRPRPASWPHVTRWRARPSEWSTTRVPAPSSAVSFFNG